LVVREINDSKKSLDKIIIIPLTRKLFMVIYKEFNITRKGKSQWTNFGDQNEATAQQ
jgi:hypothetical protein